MAKHELPRERGGHEIDFESPDQRSSAAMTDTPWRTSIGTSDADSITVQGRDLASELMGHVSFTELAFLLIRGRLPDAGETRLLDAVLVSLADHGLTPTVIAARMTHTGAPESLQGAVAAGLLGAGDVFLGVVENTARFLAAILLDSAGVAGAALADLGFKADIVRGFALIARSAGLVAHLAEEMEHPLGMGLYKDVEERTAYDAPDVT